MINVELAVNTAEPIAFENINSFVTKSYIGFRISTHNSFSGSTFTLVPKTASTYDDRLQKHVKNASDLRDLYEKTRMITKEVITQVSDSARYIIRLEDDSPIAD